MAEKQHFCHWKKVRLQQKTRSWPGFWGVFYFYYIEIIIYPDLYQPKHYLNLFNMLLPGGDVRTDGNKVLKYYNFHLTKIVFALCPLTLE